MSDTMSQREERQMTAIGRCNRNSGVHLFGVLTFVLVALRIVSSDSLVAQTLANYQAPNGTLTRTTGNTYSSIEFTGYSVPSWRFVGSGGEDDNRSYPISIGFDFWYLGTRYTTFNISTNGFIDFSTYTNDGGPSTNQYGSTDNDLSQSASNRMMPLTIAPFYYDQTPPTGWLVYRRWRTASSTKHPARWETVC